MKPPRYFSAFSIFLWGVFLFLGLQTPSTAHAKTTQPTKTSSFLTRTVKTQHFTLRFADEQAWLARRLKAKIETDYKRIASELGGIKEAHFEIRIARKEQDYATIQPHAWRPHTWIAGLAYPRQGIMTLRQQPGQGFDQLYQTFVHELSHLLLFRAAKFQPMPLWFVEGLAMQQSGDYTAFDRFLTIARAQLGGSVPSIPSLNKRFPVDGASATLAYAVSFAHLQFLQTKHPALVKELLARLRQGQSFHAALAQLLGNQHTNLLPAWKEHLRKHYHWFALLSSEGLLWGLLCLLLPFFYYRQKNLRKKQIAEMEDDASYPLDDEAPYNESAEETPVPPQHASLSYKELRQALDQEDP